jgi:GWxTD domain-containing protein
MPRRSARLVVLVLVVFAAGLAGCGGGSRLDSAHAGRTLAYQPGLPNFDLEAVATWRDGAPGIDVYLGIPLVSLVFVRADSGYAARYERVVRLLERNGRVVQAEVTHTDTVRVAAYTASQAYEGVVVEERLAVPPGSYLVEVTVTDLASDKAALRRQAVEVAAAVPGQPAISRVRLEAKPAGARAFRPVVSMHVPSGIDSLRSIVELYHLAGAPEVEVGLRLLRFESDTTVARPPYWLSPTAGSLAYRGAIYDRPDTLQVSRRRLQNVDREAVVEFDLPHLTPGIYRIETEARAVDAAGPAERLLASTRDLSVKSTTFPQITLLDELVEALTYIAYPDEIKEIRAADTPEERKRRFDAFWGALVPNRQVAANVVKLYYSRVEEANLFFTSYKEGWKTDRGMVYVVLGPPYYVENRIDAEVWYYSYGERDPSSVYVFERVRAFERDDLFETYVLQRRSFYHQAWTEAMDRWRNGTVL